MLFKFFSPHNVKTKLPFSFTKTANYLRLAADLLSTPTPQTPFSHQETHDVGLSRRPALWDVGSLAFQKKLVPTLAVELPSSSYKIHPSTRPLPCAFVSTSLLRMGVPLCIQRKLGNPWLRRKPERKRALKSSPEHIYTFQRFFRSLPQLWVLPSSQLAICNCTSLYNNEFPSPSSLPPQDFTWGVEN